MKHEYCPSFCLVHEGSCACEECRVNNYKMYPDKSKFKLEQKNHLKNRWDEIEVIGEAPPHRNSQGKMPDGWGEGWLYRDQNGHLMEVSKDNAHIRRK